MFDNRCMYYLTIVVVMLFSVSFIKLNKFWELDVRYGEVESDESMGTTIFKGVRFLIGIVDTDAGNHESCISEYGRNDCGMCEGRSGVACRCR